MAYLPFLGAHLCSYRLHSISCCQKPKTDHSAKSKTTINKKIGSGRIEIGNHPQVMISHKRFKLDFCISRAHIELIVQRC